MIQFVAKKTGDGNMAGFRVSGHAGFSECGSDVVCAGVSALVLNCINSIEAFTDTAISVSEDEQEGMIDFSCEGELDAKADLLIKSLLLGMRGIQKEYGSKYIRIYE